jgi:hypothetical protein
MITVLRQHGLRVVIYIDDHPPPHVHVIGDGEAKIILVGRDGSPELGDAVTMKHGDVRKAMMVVTEHQQMFLELWRKMHG